MPDYIKVDANGDLLYANAKNSSTGPSDSDEMVKLNAQGKIDVTMLPNTDGSSIQAGENLAARDIVYIDAASEGKKAVATGMNSVGIGFVADSINDTASGIYYQQGELSGFSSLAPNDVYFLSETIPGGITNNPPALSGQVIQKVGRAKDASTLIIEIAQPVLIG